jgi:dihydropyrimidinase
VQPILIINGTLVYSGTSRKADLLVEHGRIAGIGAIDPLTIPGCRILDAAGKFVFPGGFDPHVHLSLPTPAGPSCDDFRSGSRAALAGGTTFFIDFVTPRRGQSLHEALALRRAEASQSLTGCGLHMGISEWSPAVAAEILPLVEKEGITSFKAYLAYKESIGIGYDDLYELMKIVGDTGGLVMVHCEDGELIRQQQAELRSSGRNRACFHGLSRPPEAEVMAIERVIALSAKTGCPVYIVHVSTGKGAVLIRSAKRNGLKVYAETCPHYLLLDKSVYDPGLDDRTVMPYVLSPPIRGKEDRDGLWDALADGTFDVVATDHCPFNLYGQKDRGLHDFTKIPNGAGGIRHRLGLLYTCGVVEKRISVSRFAELVSTRPAEIFGYGHRKGKLLPGYDADLVIWDPDWEGVIARNASVDRCDSDIFSGFPVKGCPETVMLNGEIV